MNTLFEQITSLTNFSFCAFKAPANVVSSAFSNWMNEILAPEIVASAAVAGCLQEVLGCLDKTPGPIIKQSLFIETNTDWTVLVENGLSGTDNGRAPVLSEKCACEAVYANFSKRGTALFNGSNEKVLFGAALLSVYKNFVPIRILESANDGGRWVFRSDGTPYEFEDVASYTKKPISARFTTEMLRIYLAKMGLAIDNPDWYLTEKNQVNGILISRK